VEQVSDLFEHVGNVFHIRSLSAGYYLCWSRDQSIFVAYASGVCVLSIEYTHARGVRYGWSRDNQTECSDPYAGYYVE